MRLFSRFTLFFILLVSVHNLSAAPSIGRKLVDRIAVAVNNEIILESDIDKFQTKLKSKSFQELFGGVNESIANSREAALQLLIEEKLINQQVKRLELQASDQEVDGQIRAILKRNGIAMAQLTARIKQLGTTVEDYREGIRRQIERRNLIEREIKPSLEVTEEQLRHFYARHGKRDETEIQYKIAHIFFSGTKGNNLERAKTVAKDLAKSPGDFEKFAKEYSDDEATAENGGVLGFFAPSSLSKEFRAVVPKTSVNSITDPIKTANGLHILKVLELRTPDYTTLTKEQKDVIRNQMVTEEVEKKMTMWLERKKSEAHIRRVSVGEKNNDGK